jgi:hypothetical protein
MVMVAITLAHADLCCGRGDERKNFRGDKVVMQDNVGSAEKRDSTQGQQVG